MELVWIADCKHGQRLNSLNTPFEKLDKSRVEEFTLRAGDKVIWGMKGAPVAYGKREDATRGVVHVIDTETNFIQVFEDSGEVFKAAK